MKQVPAYEFAVRFFPKYLGIHSETGARYLSLGVVIPDAVIAADQRPLFATDAASIARHLAGIRTYQAWTRAARANVKNLSYA